MYSLLLFATLLFFFTPEVFRSGVTELIQLGFETLFIVKCTVNNLIRESSVRISRINPFLFFSSIF